MTRAVRLAIGTGLIACLMADGSQRLRASSPIFWHMATQADFLRGEGEHVSIDADGRLQLGPAVDLVHEATVPIVWTLLADGRGGVWAGTGNQGQVIHVAADGTASIAFDAVELEVHALAAHDGSLYVGTSPDGRVYRVAPDGSSETFFDPGDRYIWSMQFGPDNVLYVATGERGLIYRVDPSGESRVFYDTKAKNVRTLLWRNSELLAATASPGRVFAIDAAGKGFVRLDSGHEEVVALRAGPAGTVYAAAQQGGSSGGQASSPAPTEEPAPAVTATVSTEVTVTATVQAPDVAGEAAASPAGPSGKGAIFRIEGDGLSDRVWLSDVDAPYALLVDAQANLTVGTGSRGRIFQLGSGSPRPELLTRVPAQQVTAFTDLGTSLVFATSNPARLYRLGRGAATAGTYLSPVQDAGTGAAWGLIRWRAVVPEGARLAVATRSGNTPNPDETWSEWSRPYDRADGEPIASPRARYLQWRAEFAAKAAGPELVSVTAAYLPRNARPHVSGITVHPPGIVFQKPFPTGDPDIAGYESPTSDGQVPVPAAARTSQATGSGGAPTLGRRVYQKSFQSFVWKADDDNGDRLSFDIYYRREGDATWKSLRRGVWDPIFTWDTTSVPDGTYTVRIVATDATSNSPATALQGERESSSFDVDNSPPSIAITTIERRGTRVFAAFTVSDTHSPTDRVELSLDADRWQPVFPADGIADGRDERYEVDIEAPAASTVLIRATDVMNNVATSSAAIPTPR
jgi:hypothetical protein